MLAASDIKLFNRFQSSWQLDIARSRSSCVCKSFLLSCSFSNLRLASLILCWCPLCLDAAGVGCWLLLLAGRWLLTHSGTCGPAAWVRPCCLLAVGPFGSSALRLFGSWAVALAGAPCVWTWCGRAYWRGGEKVVSGRVIVSRLTPTRLRVVVLQRRRAGPSKSCDELASGARNSSDFLAELLLCARAPGPALVCRAAFLLPVASRRASRQRLSSRLRAAPRSARPGGAPRAPLPKRLRPRVARGQTPSHSSTYPGGLARTPAQSGAGSSPVGAHDSGVNSAPARRNKFSLRRRA